ncbi:MAG: MBL fold metallo-hydrolase [Deltaproteobacteria bacterium]|nr:MAG: MBL fold metallo-hydrolase [Deltaproteobacteria bacterium]
MEVGPLAENAYIVEHPATGKAVVVDPGDEGEEILRHLSERGLVLEKILLTHGHFDHVGGVRHLKEKTGATIHIHPEEVDRMRGASRQGAMFGIGVRTPPAPDVLLADGDTVPFADGKFEVLHTPGHTPGHVTFLAAGMAFVGDLIFAGSIGRTDLPGGSYDDLIRAVRAKIFTLPDDTVLFPGHGPATTVGEEKLSNPFFTGGILRP